MSRYEIHVALILLLMKMMSDTAHRNSQLFIRLFDWSHMTRVHLKRHFSKSLAINLYLDSTAEFLFLARSPAWTNSILQLWKWKWKFIGICFNSYWLKMIQSIQGKRNLHKNRRATERATEGYRNALRAHFLSIVVSHSCRAMEKLE